VDPAEVEAFFTGTGLIREAAVTAWLDSAGEQNLAAWPVPLQPETGFARKALAGSGTIR
jgi:hypothetical protein